MENNNKLDRLKQFIIDQYKNERSNPIINLDFKIAISPTIFTFSFFDKCPDNAFVDKYSYLNNESSWFNLWLKNEFSTKKIKIFMNDLANSDIYVKLE